MHVIHGQWGDGVCVGECKGGGVGECWVKVVQVWGKGGVKDLTQLMPEQRSHHRFHELQ